LEDSFIRLQVISEDQDFGAAALRGELEQSLGFVLFFLFIL
jgi:hypothetical protein